VYSEDGLFQKTIPCPPKTMSFYCLEKSLLCCSPNIDGTIKNTFNLIDYVGNIIESYPNKYQYDTVAFINNFLHEYLIYGYDGLVHTKEIYSDTVFVFDEFKFKPSFILDRKGETLSLMERKSIDSFESFMVISKESCVERKIIETNRFIYSEFSFNGDDYISIGLKENHEQSLCKKKIGIINDIDGGPNLRFEKALSDSVLISWIIPYTLKKYISSDSFKNSNCKYPEKKKALE
jgi:hypothetical protein